MQREDDVTPSTLAIPDSFVGQLLTYIVRTNSATLATTNKGTSQGNQRLNGRNSADLPRGAPASGLWCTGNASPPFRLPIFLQNMAFVGSELKKIEDENVTERGSNVLNGS